MDSDEQDIKFAEEGIGVSWGVEVEFSAQDKRSVFHPAGRVLLDGKFVQIQLPNGQYASYPAGEVRKVMTMRVEPTEGYVDEDLSPDGLY